MQKTNIHCKHQLDDLGSFTHGGFCAICGQLDEKRFLENRQPALFLLNSLLSKYMKMFYVSFERDLVMGLVMSEIWQYNLSRYFQRNGHQNSAQILNDPENRDALLTPCNTYSISQTLGIPNETVRRKIKKLVARGWVKNDGGDLRFAPAVEDLFSSMTGFDIMREFMSTSRHLIALLEHKQDDQSK